MSKEKAVCIKVVKILFSYHRASKTSISVSATALSQKFINKKQNKEVSPKIEFDL